jgi:hypothetical protein
MGLLFVERKANLLNLEWTWNSVSSSDHHFDVCVETLLGGFFGTIIQITMLRDCSKELTSFTMKHIWNRSYKLCRSYRQVVG